MKKTFVLLSFCLLVFVGGCSPKDVSFISQKEPIGELAIAQKATDIILDSSGKEVTEFESDGGLFLTENYLFFSRTSAENSNYDRSKDYFCFDLAAQEYSYLGTIENYGTSTIMGVAEMDNHIYQFILHGDPFDGNWQNDREELRLYDFDLENKTVNHIRTSKYAHPYNDLQAYDGKLLIKDGNDVVEFDVETQEEHTLLSYPEFDSDRMTGEMIYACFMDTDKHELSVVVIRVNGESDVSLRIDTYNSEMQLVRSQDISEEASHTGETNFNMLGQVVTDFFVKGNYFYYSQNAHHILGEIDGDAVSMIIDRDNQEYGIIHEITNVTDKRYFCNYVWGETIRDNRLFMLDMYSGECSQSTVEFCSEQEQILNAMRSQGGMILLQTVLPETTVNDDRIYYLLDESELTFETCG